MKLFGSNPVAKRNRVAKTANGTYAGRHAEFAEMPNIARSKLRTHGFPN